MRQKYYEIFFRTSQWTHVQVETLVAQLFFSCLISVSRKPVRQAWAFSFCFTIPCWGNAQYQLLGFPAGITGFHEWQHAARKDAAWAGIATPSAYRADTLQAMTKLGIPIIQSMMLKYNTREEMGKGFPEIKLSKAGLIWDTFSNFSMNECAGEKHQPHGSSFMPDISWQGVLATSMGFSFCLPYLAEKHADIGF